MNLLSYKRAMISSKGVLSITSIVAVTFCCLIWGIEWILLKLHISEGYGIWELPDSNFPSVLHQSGPCCNRLPENFPQPICCARQKKNTDARLDKTYSVCVCQTHMYWAGQHTSLLVFSSLAAEHAALCHCCHVEKSQKVNAISNLHRAKAEHAQTGIDSCQVLSFLLSTLSCRSLPASSLHHVKTPNKETDTPLL